MAESSKPTQQDRTPGQSLEPRPSPDNTLAACKEWIPLAKEINSKIADYIHTPWPTYDCLQSKKVPLKLFDFYSIVRISNPELCKEQYCCTVVYDDKRAKIVFSVDAEARIDIFRHAKTHIVSLDKILGQEFEHTSDGLVLTVRGGLMAISFVNEILTVSIVPRTEQK